MPFRGVHWTLLPNKEEIREKLRVSHTGKKQTKETIEKRVSKFRGRVSPMFGRKHSLETKKKISDARKGIIPKHFDKFQALAWEKNKTLTDDKSSSWKGDSVKYSGLHVWVSKHLGHPDTCEYCQTRGLHGRSIHWANKSGEYKRDLTDWIRLCVSCHQKYDKTYLTRKRDFKGRFE